ncbi:MAG: hypothetical protein CMI22_09670 [Opitutae bacterium]|nr:hypothetical protein [Opitutae bacterium]
MVLYNTTTHETLTPSDIEAGATTWMLLDQTQYPDYQHPAYYNLSSHFVVDASGTPSNGWMLVPHTGGHQEETDTDTDTNPEEYIYNTVTHEVVTLSQIQNREGDWLLLNPYEYPDYNHPAYYNIAVHQVMDQSEGSVVGDWVIVHGQHLDFDFEEPVEVAMPSPGDQALLYNLVTMERIYESDLASGEFQWMALSHERYPDYQHPAFYNLDLHQVLDQSEGSQVGDWILIPAREPFYPSDEETLLFNVESGEIIPMESVELGETSWTILSPARYGEKYDHPAFYNLHSHQVLDSSEGSQVGDWILLSGREYLDMLYDIPKIPIVETLRPSESDFQLSGIIRNSGDSEIIEFGFMASTHMDMRYAIMIPAQLDQETMQFSASLAEIDLHGTIYYRAYAVNEAGHNHGSVKIIEIETFQEADPAEGFMEEVDWFGDFVTLGDSDWIFHSKLQWLYAHPDHEGGLWLWKPGHGWLWTQDGVWPFLYEHETGRWLYLVSTEKGGSFFFDYEQHRYFPALQEE